MDEFKKEESFMDPGLSVSPEKYFDTKFEYQEKWFAEKFNTFQARIDADIKQLSSEIKRVDEKIDSVDRRLSSQFKITLGTMGIVIAMMGVVITMHI